ncbi:MAG: leucine-rich repeat domain-containing protein [Lachnospiraceae bacterium]|nr:leucine-rich repeat domain-containing protein [Lachnospiraceae bacterium]
MFPARSVGIIKYDNVGSTVTEIGKEAFFGCKNLKTVKIRTKKLKNKNVGKNAFKKLNAKVKISVPKGKLKAYRKLLKARGVTGRKQKITG